MPRRTFKSARQNQDPSAEINQTWISNIHKCSSTDSIKGQLGTKKTSTTQSRDYGLTVRVHKYFCWILIHSATSKKPWNRGRNTTKKLRTLRISVIHLHVCFEKYKSIFSYFKGSSNFWNKIKSTLIFKTASCGTLTEGKIGAESELKVGATRGKYLLTLVG